MREATLDMRRVIGTILEAVDGTIHHRRFVMWQVLDLRRW